MQLHYAVLDTPKRGNEAIGSDDSHFPRRFCRYGLAERCAPRRFAVADGASGSLYSGLWATLMTRAFHYQQVDPHAFPAIIPELAEEWRRDTEAALAARYGDSLPWYLADPSKQTAQATFLGVVIDWPELGQPRWTATARGDSCLFHRPAHGGQLVFPMSDPADFGNDPLLVPALSPISGDICFAIRVGCLEPGDRLYLMTDALAAYFVGQVNGANQQWQHLDAALDGGTPELFAEWINGLRDEALIKNDDVTVSRLVLE